MYMSFFDKMLEILGNFSIDDYVDNDRIIDLFEKYDESSIFELHGIEFYIISKFKYDKASESFKKISLKLYEAFINNPHKFFDSYLFREENINQIFSFWQVRKINRIKKSLSKEAMDILERGPKGDDERHFLMKYLKLNVDLSDKKQRKLIEEMIDFGEMPKDPEELNFLSSYISKWMLNDAGFGDLDIPIFSSTFSDDELNGYANKEYIFVQLNDKKNVLDAIQVICHETQHIIQYEKYKELKYGFSKLQDSNIGFDYFVFDNFGNEFYRKNYRFSRIELDAERSGYNYAVKFLRSIDREDLSNMVFLDKDNSFYCRGINYEYVLEPIISNSKIDYENEFYEYAMSYLLDDFVSNYLKMDPTLFDTFPILLNLYDRNGNPKLLSSLLLNDFSINDNLEFFYNHVFAYIQGGEIDKIDIDSYSSLEQMIIYNNLDIMFNRVINKINSMLDCNPLVLLDRYSGENDIDLSEIYEIYNSELAYYYSFILKISNYFYSHLDRLTEKNKTDFSTGLNNIVDKLGRLLDDDEYGQKSPFLSNNYSSFCLIYNELRKDEIQNAYESFFEELVPESFRDTIVNFNGVNYKLNNYVYNVLPGFSDINDISKVVLDGEVIDFDEHIISILSNSIGMTDNLNDILILLNLLKINFENGRSSFIDMYNSLISYYDDNEYVNLIETAFERAERYYQENKFKNTLIDINFQSFSDEVNDVIMRSRNK